MQKWEQYRLEIDQSSYVGATIMAQTQKIERYKKEIDKINPAILQGINNVNLNLHKGISEVVVSQKQIPDTITKMFKNLNKAKTSDNKNNINTLLMNLEEYKILDENKKLKEKWLNSDADYSSLSSLLKDANLSSSKDKEFEKDLQEKFQRLSVKKGQTQVGTITELTNNASKNIGHHVFVISIAIALVFFALTVALIFVGWFA